MIKLLLAAFVGYLGYNLYQRYSQNISAKTKSNKKKYSKMNIRDAEFKDLDE